MNTTEEETLQNISGTTRLLGLLGSPVGHSKSPAMYNYCFRKFGLDWVYLAFDVKPEEAGQAVQSIRTLGMRGANVTMPCKQAVIPYLDKLTPAAEAIQAVNTIINENGVLTGHNTDGSGYTRNLKNHDVEMQGKKIVLLGGGGAASAIAVQSALEGASELYIFNRKDEFWNKIKEGLDRIQKAVPKCNIMLLDLEDKEILKEKISKCDILSNATKVGMGQLKDQSLITDTSWYRKDLVVTDVVYDPTETKMLREAKAKGCKTCDGLGMLLCQGAECLKLYSGHEMPLEEIQTLLYQ